MVSSQAATKSNLVDSTKVDEKSPPVPVIVTTDAQSTPTHQPYPTNQSQSLSATQGDKVSDMHSVHLAHYCISYNALYCSSHLTLHLPSLPSELPVQRKTTNLRTLDLSQKEWIKNHLHTQEELHHLRVQINWITANTQAKTLRELVKRVLQL